MSLTTTNAQISIQDGQGAVSNVNNAAVGYYTPGALLTFALQSTTGVLAWDLTFICPAFPSLHQRTFNWRQGMVNQWQVQMPAAVSAIASPSAGIEVISVVTDQVQSIAASVCFLQTYGGAAPMVTRYARVATAATLATYTASNGVLTASANGTQTIDGVVVAVGDRVLLCTGATASDNGLYIVTTKGLAGAKFVWTRAPEWPTGATIKSGSTIEVGPEGTLFANTTWKVTASGDPVVDTTDPALYPRLVTQQITLAASTKAVANVPILSATTSNVLCSASVGGTPIAGTVGYGPVAAITPGAIGTATVTIDALASGMAKNGTTDTSVLNVTIVNW